MTDGIVTRNTNTHTHAHTYGPTNIIRLHYISVAKAASDYHFPTQANILTLSLHLSPSPTLSLPLSLLPHSSTHSDLYPRAISIKFCSSLGKVNPKSSQMSQTQTTAMSRPGIMPCPTHTHTCTVKTTLVRGGERCLSLAVGFGQGNGLSKFSNLRKFNFLEIHLTVKLIIKGNCVCVWA